jgi:hypothetical protein
VSSALWLVRLVREVGQGRNQKAEMGFSGCFDMRSVGGCCDIPSAGDPSMVLEEEMKMDSFREICRIDFLVIGQCRSVYKQRADNNTWKISGKQKY